MDNIKTFVEHVVSELIRSDNKYASQAQTKWVSDLATRGWGMNMTVNQVVSSVKKIIDDQEGH